MTCFPDKWLEKLVIEEKVFMAKNSQLDSLFQIIALWTVFSIVSQRNNSLLNVSSGLEEKVWMAPVQGSANSSRKKAGPAWKFHRQRDFRIRKQQHNCGI